MTFLTTTLSLLSMLLVGVIPQTDTADRIDNLTVREFYEKLEGDWSGPYSLWIATSESPFNSEMIAQGRFVAERSHFLLTYTWMWNDEQQGGVFLLSAGPGKATATWGDSWHMQPAAMVSEGELTDQGEKLVFHGTYATGPDAPDRAWRTEFILQGKDAFTMEAYNVTPEGETHLVVRAKFRR